MGHNFDLPALAKHIGRSPLARAARHRSDSPQSEPCEEQSQLGDGAARFGI
jgi:hypothetical protein